MEKLKAEVSRLADIELETAIEVHGLNHSEHESAGVLREEIEEAAAEIIAAQAYFDALWGGVKSNYLADKMRDMYEKVYTASICLACEAIQAAAMARKGILSNIEIYKEAGAEAGQSAAKPALKPATDPTLQYGA